MKLIHCADLHLDSRMTSFLSPEQARERRGELLQTFLRMVDYAAEQNVQAILIAGDLFDRSRVSAAAGSTFLEAVRTHPDIVFFYVAGNHEGDGWMQAVSEMPGNLKRFDSTWRTFAAGSVSITGANLTADNRETLFDSLVLDPAQFNIVLLHGQIAEYASDKKAEIIDIGAFRNKHIDYLALGHIHTYHEGTLAPRGIWCYPGCLEGRGFDECGEHGFVLLDIDTASGSFTNRFVPFAFRHLREITVDITGCRNTSEIMRRVESVLAEERIPSPDLWKLILTGSVDVSCEKDTVLIQKHFCDQCYHLRVEDRSRLEVDYNSYIYDRSLKGEFVRLVQGDRSLSEQEKAEVIRCGIQALTGEVVNA